MFLISSMITRWNTFRKWTNYFKFHGFKDGYTRQQIMPVRQGIRRLIFWVKTNARNALFDFLRRKQNLPLHRACWGWFASFDRHTAARRPERGDQSRNGPVWTTVVRPASKGWTPSWPASAKWIQEKRSARSCFQWLPVAPSMTEEAHLFTVPYMSTTCNTLNLNWWYEELLWLILFWLWFFVKG